MSDKQETLADIVAEFREIVHKSVDGIIAVKADVIADRIEAAAKREELRWATANGELAKMLTFEKAQGGNEAAMREAANATIEAIKKTDLCDYVGFETERCKGCDYYLICEAVDRLRQALSASSRNCDRLSADQCKKMFEHEMGIYLPKEATDRDREIARCTAYGVIDALYAERKGESNGK